MSGWGSIDFMRKSYENNRNLLGKHKTLKEIYTENRFFENHSEGIETTPAKPRVLRKIRQKLQRQHRNQLIKSMIVLIVAIAIVSFAFTILPLM